MSRTISGRELIADVLVVSDLHAMSPEVDVSRFTRFVDLHPARRLVLAGDTLDFYMWRHGKGRENVDAGMTVVRFLIGLAEIGVELVILPGNHDLDWEWLADEALMTARRGKLRYPDGMKDLLIKLVRMPNVAVVKAYIEGDTVVVHGHEGWQGDWLWRVSEMGDMATQYKLVGGQMRRKVMGGAPLRFRAAVVEGHGFYRRLASWGRKVGKLHIIHGHTHVDGRRVRGNVVLDCLPAWRPQEGLGGGMVLKDGVWLRVAADSGI